MATVRTLLKPEISNDPRSREFSSMTNKQVAVDLHSKNISENVESITGQQLFEATDPEELTGLDADQKMIYWGIVGMGTILVNGTTTKATLLSMFSAGSKTRTNLIALQTRMVSWESSSGYGIVKEGHVIEARRLP